MFPQNQNLFASNSVIGFTIPRLHKGKQWFVDFYAYDPTIDRMRRKKIMLGRYRTAREKEVMASTIIRNVYNLLLSGWNPFVSASNPRQYTLFAKVLERYCDYVDTSEKKGILKPKTATDYRSRAAQLKEYLASSEASARLVSHFDRTFVVDFLDYLFFDKDVSARTRNNYRGWLTGFASWLIERKYINENPVEDIKTLRESDKFRHPLTADALRRLSNHLAARNPHFYLACLMEYYTFIRPDELRHITLGDISIEKQTVRIGADIAKNRTEQYVALNDKILRLMISLDIFTHHHSKEYLFSDGLRPGEKMISVNRLRQEWAKVRKALRFPPEYQFYSLKDSGIRDLANAQGIVVARDQARHYDVSITNKYLKNDVTVHNETKHFEGDL